MSKPIILHSYRRCPFAMRVRMTLHEKKLPFEVIEENLRDKSEQLKRLHPNPSVPLLLHGEKIIYESSIITEYLDDLYPEVKLMPEDITEKTDVRLWTAWCDQVLKPDIDIYKYGPVRLTTEEVEQGKKRLEQHLQKLENQIIQTGWLVGNQMTLADIHVFPFYRQLNRVNPPFPAIEEFPAVKKWLEKITARPSFAATMKKNPA